MLSLFSKKDLYSVISRYMQDELQYTFLHMQLLELRPFFIMVFYE